jgi:hypothetical protein
LALIEINRNPSPRELRWFGAIVLAVFGVLGGVVWWQLGSPLTAQLLWGVGLAGALLFYAVRQLRLSMYLAWMTLVAPIGWVVSHLALALVFYGVVTPIALCMRLFGRDKLERRFDRPAASYWVSHDPGGEVRRYLRQT